MIHDLDAVIFAGMWVVSAMTVGLALARAAARGDRMMDRALREDREVADLDEIWELSA